MTTKIETFNRTQLKKDLPDIRPGDTIKVYQKIPARNATQSVAGGKEGDKERIQIFEGIVIARKHGKEIGATITVRKIVSGVGVERIFPIHSPTIEKIEIINRGKVRKAKLYYLRKLRGKKAKLKKKRFIKTIAQEPSFAPNGASEGKEETIEEKPTKEVKEEKKEEK